MLFPLVLIPNIKMTPQKVHGHFVLCMYIAKLSYGNLVSVYYYMYMFELLLCPAIFFSNENTEVKKIEKWLGHYDVYILGKRSQNNLDK